GGGPGRRPGEGRGGCLGRLLPVPGRAGRGGRGRGARGGAAGRVGAGRGGRRGRPGGRHQPVPDRHPALLPLSAEPMSQRDPEPRPDDEEYAGYGPEPGYSQDGGYGRGPGPDPDQGYGGAAEPGDGGDDGHPDPAAETAGERDQAEPGAERLEEDLARVDWE